MLNKFCPNFSISPKVVTHLMNIESVKSKISTLPVTPKLLASLRETARLFTTHYSTMIEGNQLTNIEVKKVIELKGHFPGRERDENEVKGYYAALRYMEDYVLSNQFISEDFIKMVHALLMNDGRVNVKATPYRDGQNVIKDSNTKAIIYMPPEAKDVSGLMYNLVEWIKEQQNTLPCPIIAAIGHYQFATIHPYYDGNGRTARLLTTCILHLGGYGLKGLFSLEEYYARDLLSYYRSISIGPSHNYYLGRVESDITSWLEYFLEGMDSSFGKVEAQMSLSQGMAEDLSPILRKLDPKQRKVLELFKEYDIVSSKQIGDIFGFKQRTRSALCNKWVQMSFLEIVNESLKARTYKLAPEYLKLIE